MSDAPQAPAEIFPSTSRDFVNALSHYYRGEISRMISWRDRIDRTTNWAIGAVAGMLSLSLSTPQESHGVLLFAMLVIFLILFIESRRYRFFHIYRSRVRLLERHYYARLLTGVEISEAKHWMSQLGDDLRAPSFSLTLAQALSRRLRRNYIWLFLILLLAWLLKASGLLHPAARIELPAESGLLPLAAVGAIPGWAVAAGVAVFYLALAVLTARHRERTGELAYGEAHF